MKREPDPAARRVVIPIGTTSRLVVDRFDGYDELVEMHVYWHPGVRAAGYTFNIGDIVDKDAELERTVVLARYAAEGLAEVADLLQPHMEEGDLTDVKENTKAILKRALEDDDDPLRALAKYDVATRARRRPAGVGELRALVKYWDEVYDGDYGDRGASDARKAAVAKHYGWSVRTLDERLAAAKKAGLKYRGMKS